MTELERDYKLTGIHSIKGYVMDNHTNEQKEKDFQEFKERIDEIVLDAIKKLYIDESSN